MKILLLLLALSGAAWAEDDKLADFEKRLNASEAALKELRTQTGLTIHGEAHVLSQNMLRLKPATNASRLWPTVGLMDLSFTGKPMDGLEAFAAFRMENVFGGYWNNQNRFAVRRLSLSAHGEHAGFELGDVAMRHTPLTLYANSDDEPYAAPLLAQRRAWIERELMLGNHAWPLQGLHAEADGPWGLQAQAWAARLGQAGKANSNLSFSAPAPHDQMLYAGRGGIASGEVFRLGISYFDVDELGDTGGPGPVENQHLAAADMALHLGFLRLEAEGARCSYTSSLEKPAVWLMGSAARASLSLYWNALDFSLGGNFVQPRYIFAPAQTRTQTRADSPLLETGNILFDASAGVWGLAGYSSTGLTKFNNSIQSPSLLMPWHPQLNNSSPQGDATPNRQGGRVGLGLRLGFFEAKAWGSWQSEQESPAYAPIDMGLRKYLVAGAGGILDLRPVRIGGFLRSEDTRSDKYVALSSSLAQAWVEWEALRHWKLSALWRHLDANGADYSFWNAANPTWGAVDMTLETYGGSMNWQASEATELMLGFTHSQQGDALTASENISVQEWDARISTRF